MPLKKQETRNKKQETTAPDTLSELGVKFEGGETVETVREKLRVALEGGKINLHGTPIETVLNEVMDGVEKEVEKRDIENLTTTINLALAFTLGGIDTRYILTNAPNVKLPEDFWKEE